MGSNTCMWKQNNPTELRGLPPRRQDGAECKDRARAVFIFQRTTPKPSLLDNTLDLTVSGVNS